jgi:hypothetical protein
MRSETLEGYTASKGYESEGYRLLYWLDADGRPHRGDDLPAIVKVGFDNGEVLERTWMTHAVEHRNYGRPSFVGRTVQRYVADGRPYDVDKSFSALYSYFFDKGVNPIDCKRAFDFIVNRYFLGNAIGREQVVEYAKARLEQINSTQACHGMKYVEGGSVIQETSSKTPDIVFRFDEGPVGPLLNETTPKENPGKVHNYVIVFYPEVDGTMCSHIEFLGMNLVEVKSKHAHILLSKIATRFPDFRYFISGECIYDGDNKSLSLNIQSGMNWQLNLSRFTKEDIQEIKDRMRVDIAEGNLSFPGSRHVEDFGYVLLQDILRTEDLFGAVARVFFEFVLGFVIDKYATSSFRGQTKESLNVVKDWCEEGITIRMFNDTKTCNANPETGINFCSPESMPPQPSSDSVMDYTVMTINEIKTELDRRGIRYPTRPRRNQLVAMLMESDERR